MSTSQDQFFHGCYYPDRSPAYNHTACNAASPQSACCAEGHICLDNGYCLQTSGSWSNRLGRHSCTDKTWGSASCPQYCADRRTYASVGLYLAYDRPGGAFCCAYNVNQTTGQCQNATRGSSDPFNLPDGNVIYNRSNGAIINIGQVTLANLTAEGLIVSSNATAISPAADTSSTAAAANSNIVPIAVGIAVPLIVLLLATLIACGILFSQNRHLRREKEDYNNRSHALLMETSDNARQGAASPAPVYEYKAPTAQVTWTGEQSPPIAYAALGPRPPIEAGSMHIGELPTNEIRQSGK